MLLSIGLESNRPVMFSPTAEENIPSIVSFVLQPVAYTFIQEVAFYLHIHTF